MSDRSADTTQPPELTGVDASALTAASLDGVVATGFAMTALTQLRPHEENVKIYGDRESVADLTKSIGRYGIHDPLVITADKRVISGHRRFRAAKELGLEQVPVRVFASTDKMEILNALLEYNRHRIKSKVQLAAEANLQMRIEKEFATRRKAAAAGKSVVEKLPPQPAGKSRDAVGKKLGISGRSAAKAAKVSEAITTLRTAGKIDDANDVEEALNKGFDTGLNAAIAKGAIDKPKAKSKSAALERVGNDRSKAEVAEPVMNSADERQGRPPEPVPQTPSMEEECESAMTMTDTVITFLRSPAARGLTPQQKKDWGKIFNQLEACRTTLGL